MWNIGNSVEWNIDSCAVIPLLVATLTEVTLTNVAINLCRYYHQANLLLPLTKGHLSNVATFFDKYGGLIRD